MCTWKGSKKFLLLRADGSSGRKLERGVYTGTDVPAPHVPITSRTCHGNSISQSGFCLPSFLHTHRRRNFPFPLELRAPGGQPNVRPLFLVAEEQK